MISLKAIVFHAYFLFLNFSDNAMIRRGVAVAWINWLEIMFYGLLPIYILIGALFASGGAIVNPGQSSLLEIPPFAAVIPSAFNADNKTDAAFLSDSLASVKTPTDSPMNDPLPTAVEINRFNPAARNGFSIKERKCVISGLSPICRMSIEIPAYGLSLLDKPVICSGVIDRGANFSSIFTLAK